MPATIHYSHCPCCAAKEISFLMACKDYVATGDCFDIWHCKACSARFVQNAPSLNEIHRYYDSDKYRSHSVSDNGVFDKMYQLARRYSVWWRYRQVRRGTRRQTGSLLDIGSGVGAFAAYMKKKGWQAMALEPDEDARKAAMQQYGLEVGPMEKATDLAPESLDVVTMWHVLEHVHDIHGYLQNIHRILKPDGVLVVAVPNYESADAAHYRAHWDAYDAPRHLFHFSPASLRHLVGMHGFTVSSTRFFWLDAFFASLLSEEHMHGRKRWIAASLYGIYSNIRALAKKETASAVTYVIRKK